MNYKEEYKKWLEPPEGASSTWFRQRGYAFEEILKNCLNNEGMDPRSSYKADGEQIDGSFFLDGSVFLLEAKWHSNELPASSIYQFKGKVDGKLLGTIGVFISMSGYSKDAVDALTLGKSLNVILFGKEDIDAALIGNSTFKNVLKSKLRIAAEQGVVYHSTNYEQATKDGQIIIEAFTYDNMSSSLVRQDANFEGQSDLVVICEGSTDREIISLLATRILRENGLAKKVNIVVAMGKMTIPRVANATVNIGTSSPVLIVTDSDDDFSGTRDMLKRGVELSNWEYAIPDPAIESWLGVKREDLRRVRRADNMREFLSKQVEQLDLNELAAKNDSFKILHDWVKNA
ncbi:restriction endonuclease [Vibrio splendidus]